MNEDYLWDQTGEPDPEIQQLEEILGTLRYQPKPLEIPQELITPRRRRNLFPALAIAASILLALLAVGVWLRMRTERNVQPREAKIVTPVVNEKAAAVNNEEQKKNSQDQPRGNELARNNEQVRKGGLPPLSRNKYHTQSPALTRQEREEALAAKEQLMIALRLTTEKLNLVHRKTQITTPSNQIKNQHRVG